MASGICEIEAGFTASQTGSFRFRQQHLPDALLQTSLETVVVLTGLQCPQHERFVTALAATEAQDGQRCAVHIAPHTPGATAMAANHKPTADLNIDARAKRSIYGYSNSL